MTLEEIRVKIDQTDTKMKTLFIERMECAKHVAEVKAESGQDVFVPSREKEIIEKRGVDVDEQIRHEYEAFLKYTMSVSRRYQYTMLHKMQEVMMEECTRGAGIDVDQPHRSVEISFSCEKGDGRLSLCINMAALNRTEIECMNLTLDGMKQNVSMTLEGNLKDKNMRCLLCQMAKEADGFLVTGIK